MKSTVNWKLDKVIDLIVHFIEYDQDLKQMSYEVGAWFRDTMAEVSHSHRICNDDALTRSHFVYSLSATHVFKTVQ